MCLSHAFELRPYNTDRAFLKGLYDIRPEISSLIYEIQRFLRNAELTVSRRNSYVPNKLVRFSESAPHCICRLMVFLAVLISNYALPSDDHGDTLEDATTVGSFSSTAGTLDSPDDLDIFRVELTQFGVIIATTESDIDTYGRLLDSDGRTLASNDDSGTDRNFSLELEVEPGTVFIEVSGYGRNDVGNYRLNIEFESSETRQNAAINLGDFNGDGFDDILLRNMDGRWYYYPMHAETYIDAERGFAPITRDLNYGLAGIGDFDGDGKDDVLLRHLDGRFLFYYMNGRQPLYVVDHPEDMPTGSAYQVVGIGEFSSFGERDDILLRNRLTGEWILVEMSSFARDDPHVSEYSFRELTEDIDLKVVALADFDGNGIDDLLMRQPDGRWYFYLIDRFKNVIEEGYLALDEDRNLRLVGVGDLNADGRDDIVLRRKDGEWLYYAMDGARQIKEDSGEALLPKDANLTIAGIGDLNGDMRDDILIRHVNGPWRYFAMDGRTPANADGISLPIAKHLTWQLPVRVFRATVAGQLQITEGQILDGDTGDPADPQMTNNDAENAQQVPLPSSIAGYLMQEIDDVDTYRVRLPTRSAKTRVSLVIADSLDADFDIHLADEDGNIVGESLGVSENEVIETTRSGWHRVVVSAKDGTSNYVLVVSAQLTDANFAKPAYTASSDGNFVRNELILTPREVKSEIRSDLDFGDFEVRHKEWIGSGSSIARVIHLSTQNPTDLTHPVLTGFAYQDRELKERSALLYSRKTLLKIAPFVSVEPNYIYSINREPDDPLYVSHWHYASINLPNAWDYTIGDDEVIVAVIDTGILPDHPDIASRILRENGRIAGYDFIRDPSRSNDGDGIDPDPTDPGDAERPGERNTFHGTHVGGTVGMATNNARGGSGVTWSGKILPIRVLGRGGGTTADIAEGIRYAAGLSNSSGTFPVNRADVINLSLGLGNPYCLPTRSPTAEIRSAIESALDAGVVVVNAAGNDDCSYPSPMTKIDGVISVGATDFRNARSWYSNYGSEIDVVAPGGDTSSDLNDDGAPDGVLSTAADLRGSTLTYNFRNYQGTSMAAPHMAGVVSLMLAINPNLTPRDVNRLLDGTHSDASAAPITTDIGAPGKDSEHGNGLINALRAVQVARAIRSDGGALPTEPVLSVSPSHLSFGFVEETLRLQVENIGFGDLDVQSIESDVPWLSFTYDDPTIIVTADRFDLEEGTHLGRIQVTSNGGVTNISVAVQVQEDTAEADVGTVYVMILDAQNHQTRGWGTTNVRSGYSFQLPVVDGGRYFVTAGTDRDGDGFICDAGEACGRWPLLDSPNILEVEGDAQIEFGVSIDLFARITSQSHRSTLVPDEGIEIDRTVSGDSPH